MSSKVRLKAQFAKEFRYFSVEADAQFEACMGMLALEYGTKVILCYVDDEGDTITVRTQAELRTALEGYIQQRNNGAGGNNFRVILKPDCSDSAAEDILKQQLRLHAQITAVATTILDAAARTEPAITRMLQRFAAVANGNLVHLDHRLKTRTSLTRKLFHAARTTKASVQAIAQDIKDALRYTVVLETEDYSSGTNLIVKELEGLKTNVDGVAIELESVQIKNFWVVDSADDGGALLELSASQELEQAAGADGLASIRLKGGQYVRTRARPGVYTKDRTTIRKGDEYQGINSVWRERTTGFLWELQFHTRESLEVKEVSHKVYEKYRLETDPVAIHDMYEQMVEMWDSVPRPASVETIGSGVGLQTAPQLPPIPPERRQEFEAQQLAKSEALKVARTTLNGWIESRAEAIVTALCSFLAVKYDVRLHNLHARLLGKYQVRYEVSKLARVHACSLMEAATKIVDALRLTVVVPDANYSAVVQRWLTDMQRNSQTLMQVTNRWSEGRGVTAVIQTEDAKLYVVHFHTTASLEKDAALSGQHDDAAGEDHGASQGAAGSAADTLAAELKRQQTAMNAAYQQTPVPQGALAIDLASCRTA